MSNARIDRMLRELTSDPPVQFFQMLFSLIGLGQVSAPKVALQPVQSRTELHPR